MDRSKLAGLVFLRKFEGEGRVEVGRLFMSKLLRFLKADVGLLEHVL